MLAIPLQQSPFSAQIVPCQLCKTIMNYEGPCVDSLMTYHVYICPTCEDMSCAAVKTVGGGKVEWVTFQ